MRPRLYLAEGIPAVVEVKSDVSGQWEEVEGTAARLSPLQRNYGAGISFGAQATPHIPLFAIGYTGWKTIDPLVSRLVPGGGRHSRDRLVALRQYGQVSRSQVH